MGGVEEETPEWLQENKDDDEGGKGKRHKDEEGQMGKKDEKKTKNKYGIEGPPDNQDPHMARDEAKQMEKSGNEAEKAGGKSKKAGEKAGEGTAAK